MWPAPFISMTMPWTITPKKLSICVWLRGSMGRENCCKGLVLNQTSWEQQPETSGNGCDRKEATESNKKKTLKSDHLLANRQTLVKTQKCTLPWLCSPPNKDAPPPWWSGTASLKSVHLPAGLLTASFSTILVFRATTFGYLPNEYALLMTGNFVSKKYTSAY